MRILKTVRLTAEIAGTSDLGAIYRSMGCDYPKFFKMDRFCKLGFLVTERLLENEPERFVLREDRAVAVFTRSGCLDNDLAYVKTVQPEEYFPSPSLFVYTLPNTVTGEIAIRNKYKGDTSAFVLPTYDEEAMAVQMDALFQDGVTRSALCLWLECPPDGPFEAVASLVVPDSV